MYSRTLCPPKDKSFFLFGPRGTGKTTWVKSNFTDAIYLDLLESEIFNDLLANPSRIEKYIPSKQNKWIIIDEVQRVPELLNEVHRLIENSDHKFVLTGSSARKLRRKGHNLLAGRALTCHMHQLTAKELAGDFDLNHSIKYGSLPNVYADKDPKAFLESYVRTYLEEEIRQEGLTRNLAAFSRFLEAASFSQGSILNISEVARECAVERKAVESYFNVLEELLIAYRVPVFVKRSKRRLPSHPKFYFFDAGVYRTVRPSGPLDMPELLAGASFETLVFQELNAVNDNLKLGYKIFYWRTADGNEVDFILYGEKGLFAFEVKNSTRLNSTSFRGLKAFIRDYPSAKAHLIYTGNREMREGRIRIIPIRTALNELGEILSGK